MPPRVYRATATALAFCVAASMAPAQVMAPRCAMMPRWPWIDTEGDLRAVGERLSAEYQRLARAETARLRGGHDDIPVVPRAMVVSPPQWQLLANRCADEIASRDPTRQLEAFQFALSHLLSVARVDPQFAARIPPKFFRSSIAALESTDQKVKLHALMALQFARSFSRDPLEAVPAVLRKMEDPDPAIRKMATQAIRMLAMNGHGEREGLGEHGPAAVAALLKGLEERDRPVRVYSYSALGTMAEAGRAAVPTLTARLRSADPRERSMALRAIESLGSHAEDAAPAVAGLMASSDEYERMFAVRTLGAIAPRAALTVSALVKGLTDSSNQVATACADTLGHIGPHAAAALPNLRAAVAADPGAFEGRGAWAIQQIEGNAER